MVSAEIASPSVRWGEVAGLLRGRRWRLAAIVVLVLGTAALELAPPVIVQRLIDDHLKVGKADGLWLLAVLYLGAVGGGQVFTFFHSYLTATVAQYAIRDLRVRLVRHIQKLPTAYYDRTPTGDLISRSTADVETINTLFSSGVATLITDLARLATVTVAMVALSPFLTAVSLIAIPPAMGVTQWFRRRIVRAERETRRAVGAINVELQETLSGAEVIRAFGREEVFLKRFQRALLAYMSAFSRTLSYTAFFPCLMAMISAAAAGLLLWLGVSAHDWWPGMAEYSVGTLAAFVLLFRRFYAPIIALGEEWQTVQQAIAGAERIFEVLGEPPEEKPQASGSWPASSNGRPLVVIEGLRFGYREGSEVLHGLDLSVGRGEHLALVGRTGAGKTTILHLLAGQYAPWAGTVRIAGLDPRAVAPEERRYLFGMVPQTVQLFDGTVHDNLTLYDRQVSREAAEQACRLAGAHDFIAALPQGYDTPLGSRGLSLSAGQRQLLALARALVWNAPLLLLDEATSAIDAATEQATREALRAVSGQRAVVTVAHRLATAREADRVLVLAGGQVVEEGAPDDLIAAGGRFAAMVQLEQAGWHWETLEENGSLGLSAT